jgi:hypothetical protein
MHDNTTQLKNPSVALGGFGRAVFTVHIILQKKTYVYICTGAWIPRRARPLARMF